MSRDKYPKGLYNSPTYTSWRAMRDRCNPDTKYELSQKYYVSRGITVCDKWKKFSGFLEDMGVKPEGFTIDRIDNSKGYYKGNCRWASRSGQNKNRRTKSSSGFKYIYNHTDVGFNILINPFKSFYSRTLLEALNKRDELLELRNCINFKGDTMLFDSITFTARKNLGNYEHEELSITTHVEEGEDVHKALIDLKALVKASLNNETVQKVEAPKKENEIKGETKVTKEKPQTKEVKKEEVKEEPKKEEPKKEEVKEEPKKEEPKKEEPKKEVKKETERKVKATKATTYDRELDTHKALLGQFLDKEFPNWRNKDVLPKASKASRALQGTEFQDGEGNILDSFKEAFRPYMA